jgi:hypothetical protein
MPRTATKPKAKTKPKAPPKTSKEPVGTDRFWPIDAVGTDGTVVLEDGRMLTIVAVEPPNVDVMDQGQLQACWDAFLAMNSLLESGATLQFLVEGDLLGVDEHMQHMREEIQAVHGFDPADYDGHRSRELTPTQFSAWGVYNMQRESVEVAANGSMTMRRRCYIAIPWDPNATASAEILSALPALLAGSAKRASAKASSVGNDGPRAVTDHRRDTLRIRTRLSAFLNTLERQEIRCRVLGGVEVLEYLQRRGQPTSTTRGRVLQSPSPEMLADFNRPIDREQAVRTATNIRSLLGSAPINFKASEQYGIVDQDIVSTSFLSGTPSSLHQFWLRQIIQMREPFTLSVFMTGLDRAQEQQRITRRWKQAARENERNASKGNPDPETVAQEVELGAHAQQMAMDPMAGPVLTATYLMVRSPGPKPDANAVDQAKYEAASHVQRATQGGTLNPGVRIQEILWRSTLPLGTDYAKRTVTMEADCAADTVPLVGTGCGSPTGLPFLVSATGEIEYLAPYDRRHPAHIMVVAGTTGTGKTHLANRFLAALTAMGAQVSIIDRAGHYDNQLLLHHGARKLAIGSETGKWAINHWDVDDPADVPQSKVRFLTELHAVMLGKSAWTREEEALLAKAIRATYANALSLNEAPRESHLVEILALGAAHEREHGRIRSALVLEAFHADLQEFVMGGLYGHLWDRETNIPDDAPLLIFDTADATESMLIPLMFATMDWIRQRARRHHQRHKHDPGTYAGRSVVWLDEGWSWGREPALARYIQELARQSRHLGLLFGVMSQDTEDFEGEASAVLRNASIRILLRQDQGMIDYLSATLRLSPEVVDRLAGLRSLKGRFSEALVMNGSRGAGRVQFKVGALEYWAYTSDPNHDVPLREQALEACGGNIWKALATLKASHGIPTDD